MEEEIPSRLATLGHPHRFALYRLLMRRYPDRVPAQEIASALQLKPSTLSNHLSALMTTGLVTQQRSGTSLRYQIDMATAQNTFEALFLDCCRGRPELCAPQGAGCATGDTSTEPARVLFICTGNSARSVFAESLLRDLGGNRFEVCSAGTIPKGAVHPSALDVLQKRGHATDDLRSKSLDVFRNDADAPFDFVITVCNRAANEDAPPWPGQPIYAHWGMAGPDADQTFETTYDTLKTRIETFTNLPFDRLDRRGLQSAVDDIGQRHTGV